MTAFIENPRRAPRLPAGCRARVALRSGACFITSTVDVGPGGCGVLAGSPGLEPGERAFVEIEHEGVEYHFTGRVAWSSSSAPVRGGVAFDAASLRTAAALFTRLASECRDRAADARIERIPESAILARTPVPGSLSAIGRDEAAILLAVGDGLEARALPDRLGTGWRECVNVLFALLERGAIEVRVRPGDS